MSNPIPPLITNAVISIQRQDVSDNSFSTVLTNIPAMVVYPQDTQITPEEERERIRILIGYGYDVRIDDRVIVPTQAGPSGAQVTPPQPITFTVQAADLKAGLLPLTQILAIKAVQ